MYGGLGDDTYFVDALGDITSDAGGTDAVISSVSLSLAYRTSIENLALTDTAVSGFGNASDNIIIGNAGASVLSGADGNDLLSGGDGADKLYGGNGSDIFQYQGLSDSTADFAGRDVIYDFVEGTDAIDLAAIDADSGTPGDDAFTFIGTAAFTAAGQIRYESGASGLVLYANVDGDLAADFSIRLAGVSSVTAAAFNL
ncbi:MAG: M10 family metallopeptidase C-terminal domain-containing protein [Alphaproteobacteria bacterium]|nr:M10 family metallopeptidase C-terminal domain-containing protein [Alphaproteobacteria bacterium]